MGRAPGARWLDHGIDGMTDFPAPIRPFIAAMPGSRIREVSKLRHSDPKVLPLWFGEGDRQTPQFIRDAATRAMNEGKTFYSPNAGVTELRAAVAKYETGLGRKPIAIDRVLITASGVNAIMLVMQALVDPGDNVVLVTPLWPNCSDAVEALNGEARRVALDVVDGRWRLDLDKLFAACDARTRAIFINSPGNPTGWMASSADLAAIVDFCRKRRIWAIGDEVYERIVYGRKAAPSLLDHAGPDDPVIGINSFSKAWCMTGWRLGWVIHPPALGDTMGKITEFNISSPATFSQHAGVSALEQGEDFIKELVENYSRARDMSVQRLSSLPRVSLVYPEAAFYVFFKVDGAADSLKLAIDILNKTNVGLAPGVAFGPEGEGYLRLCFARSLGSLGEALERVAGYLK